jgi:hypothetical protein
MKTFKQYIFEDIELVSDISRMSKSDLKDVESEFTYSHKKNLGNIHKDYSIYKSNGNFYITHDPSKKVIGHISNDTPHKSKNLTVGLIGIHKDHTKKKIGHSLAVAAYKHLHELGYTIDSGREQSVGGASIWQSLLKDPEIRKNIRAVYKPFGGSVKDLGQATELHTGNIWTSGSGSIRRKASTRGIQMHKYGSPEAEITSETRLVLKAKKK